MPKEREQPDEYWNHDERLGDITIHGESYAVRLRRHASSERYHERREIVPVAENGTRFYVHARPYILVPEVRLTIGVYDQPRGDIVGEVTDSQWTGMEHREIGNAQAYYYPADRVLLLWECYLFDHYRAGDDPTGDPGLQSVWEGFERLLLRRYPKAERIATPSHEPMYEEGTLWQDFLRQQGYHPLNQQAFVKSVHGQT